MKDTIQQAIVQTAAVNLAGNPLIIGVIDGVPDDVTEYTNPPNPPTGWGRKGHPFCWVFEVDEVVEKFGSSNAYNAVLTLQIEVAFFYRPDKAEKLESVGRQYIGEIQATIMADPGMGVNPTTGGRNSHMTQELRNWIDRIPGEAKAGVAVVQYAVHYQRSTTDPRLRRGTSDTQ